MSTALTRIQNNQITDSTIQAQAKLAAGSITGNLLASTVTFNSNITILGNLTVANSYTQLNSINTYINDPVVVFNNNYSGSLTNYDIGILVNRNLATLAPYGSVNTFFGWVENDQAFEAIATTETGTNVSSINNSGFANVKIGNLTAITGSFSGGITAPSLTVPTLNATSGNITTLVAPNFSSGNSVITGGSINGTVIGNTTPAAGYFTTAQTNNFSTANAVISGGYISALTNAAITNATLTNFASGNAQITGGALSGVTGNFTTLQGTNFSSGNAQITGGALSGVTGNFTTLQGTNFSSGNAQITGGNVTGIANGNFTTLQGTNFSSSNVGMTTATATNFSSGNVVLTGGYAQGLANVYATLGQFTNFSSGNVLITGGSITGTSLSGGSGYFTTLQGTNFSSGNVLITGGYAQGLANVYATLGQFTNLSSGNAVITGGYAQGLANVYATTAQATNFSTGNARVTGGFADNFPIGANTAATGAFTTLTNSGTHISGGNIVAASGTASTNTTTGALVVKGGVGVSGDAYIGGNLSVSGTLTYINTTQEIVTGVEIVAGNLVANSGTASTNTTTGALVVQGGAGISGAIYAGSVQNTPIGSSTASTGAFTTLTSSSTLISGGNVVAGSGTTSTNTTTGALVVVGGLGVSGNINTGSTTAQNRIAGNLLLGQGSAFASTSVALEVNQNTDTPQTSTGVIHVSAKSGASGEITLDSFGGTSTYVARFSAGTSTSPSGALSGNVLAGFIGRGYGTTGFFAANAVSSPGLVITAAENFSDTNQGTSVRLNYTPTGSNIASPAMYIDATTGNIVLPNNSQSVSPTTGALVVRGGQGVVGNLWVGGYANIAGGFTAGTITNTPIQGSTGAFTSLSATTLVATNFSTGNAVISGGYISALTNAAITTATVTNGTVTNFQTANAVITGGSLNNISIGVTTPAAGVFTNITSQGIEVVSGNIVAASGQTSYAPTQGAIVIAGTGGLGVGGNVNIGQTLFVGTSHLTYSPQNAGIQYGASQNNFSQIVNQNASNGNNASTDFAAVANNGSDNDTYIDMGITSSTYSQSAYTLYGANDGYLIVAGNTTTGGGNLILNTYNANDIIFATYGTQKNNEVARITSGNVVLIKSTNNAAPAANTGALQVWGGGSITGNAYVGGAITLNGSQGAGNDVIVKGKNDATLIWARPNATYDQVIIGNSATSGTVVRGAKLQINSTDSFLMPVGTNAQRPSSTGGTDTQGMLRYNTTINGMEVYNGTAWQAFTTSFTVIADAQFTGTGSQTAFTLATSQTTASCIVSINGVVQIPTLAYSVSGTTLTFTEAPASTDIIDVRMLTTTVTVTQIASVNGYNQFLVDNNGAYVYTGTSSPTLSTTFLSSGAQLNSTPNVSVSTTGNTAVDSFFANTYSSAEYTVTGAISGTNIKEISKILVVTDGTNVYRTVYGVTTTTGNTLTNWSANIYNNSATLWATPSNANMIYRIRTNYQAI